MVRPREFDADVALDGAISVFREHGFEGSSTQMLVDAMSIGRQSLYAAFGDKWQLYCSAVRRYAMGEMSAHIDALRSGARAIDGIEAMLRRVVETAQQPCLGVAAICEFGASRAELVEINARLGKSLRTVFAERLRDAQREGDVAAVHDPEATADFLIASIAGLRVSGRGCADKATLNGLADMALRALR